MQFSPQQDAALKAVSDWYRNGDKQVFHFFGVCWHRQDHTGEVSR